MYSFIPSFNEFFNSLNSFEKKLILWSCIYNPHCPASFYGLMLQSTEDYNKDALTQNYYGSNALYVPNIRYQLKDFQTKDLDLLRLDMKQLDGTLLSDIVGKFCQVHNIFICYSNAELDLITSNSNLYPELIQNL